jgi:hypothetical protein
VTNIDRKAGRPFPQGCVFGFLTVGTLFYQRQYYPVCQGGLSAGFPIAFLCDGSGGSPIGSWGKIDLADWVNGNPLAFLLDFLLYGALNSLAGLIVMGLFRKGLSQDENFRWGVLLCFGCIVAFLTPFGTPPPPAWTPFPTLGP